MKKNEARVKWKLMLLIKASDPANGYSTTDDIDSWVAPKPKIFLRRFADDDLTKMIDAPDVRRSDSHFSPWDNKFRVIDIVQI